LLFVPFGILYEDAQLLAVDKPAGVVVIPARGEPIEASLRARLESARRERLWIVHRIDRDTSGVVVFARDAESHRALSTAFEARSVSKTYRAYTRGALPNDEGTLALPLHAARKGKMRPAHEGEPDALPSETLYRVLRVTPTVLGPVATLDAQPRTGRQHQIRVHLRAAGAPLLIDPLYGRCDALAADELGLGSPALTRLTLHAAQLTVPHPRSGDPVTFVAPLPPDLSALDAWLMARG
jgi:tRNA pseudouridine32 synthase/23S rRNA pseudouridine746 synthase